MLTPTVRRTWAPRGRTPQLRCWDRRDRVSVVSALVLSPTRRRFGLYFDLYPHNIRTADCVVGGFLQFHTFENMTLKVKRTEIQDGCAVNFGATVMGGAVIERDTTLLPLSLILKEMHLLTGAYEGSPAELVSGSTVHSPIALRRGGCEVDEPESRPRGPARY